jgi:hypothetical protein
MTALRTKNKAAVLFFIISTENTKRICENMRVFARYPAYEWDICLQNLNFFACFPTFFDPNRQLRTAEFSVILDSYSKAARQRFE